MTETLVCELSEDAVRIRTHVAILEETGEAQWSTGGLFRRCVGSMTRFDKGNR
jgi:hypothetical protein